MATPNNPLLAGSSNTLGVYDPLFYSNQSLIILHNVMGLARRVYRSYDKTAQQKGSTIAIPVPSSFTAQDATNGLQAINTDSINLTLDQWREVKFALSDAELNFTQQEIITKHVYPATIALAQDVDAKLCSLYRGCGWSSGTAGTPPSAVTDIINARKTLFNNKTPLGDQSKMHLMIDGTAEANFLALQAFTQFQGAGANAVESQMSGNIGRKYGFEIFSNQNVATHTPGTATATAFTLASAAALKAGAVSLEAASVTGTIVPGDVLQIAGDAQNYVVYDPVNVTNAPYTASGNSFNNIPIYPHLKVAAGSGTAVTLVQKGGVRNLAFHENFCALAIAPLSDLANGLGVRISTVFDPITQLALRSRVWYNGDASSLRVGLDILFGMRVLDPNLACAMLG